MAQCPYCHEAIEPPPKRARKCPHCGECIEVRKGRLFTSAAVEEFDERRDAAEAAKRLKEGRRNAARVIQAARKYGLTAGFEPMVSDDACKVCLAIRGQFIPLRGCKPEMLPPFANCGFSTGCESTYTEVLKEDRRLYAKAHRRPGCLKRTIMLIIIAIGASVLWAAFRRWLGR